MDQIRQLLLNDSQKLNFFGKIIFALAVILVGAIIIKAVKKVLFMKLKVPGKIPTSKLETIQSVIFNITKALVIFIGLMIILEAFGINTNSLIATAGIGGVAIGFGAQYIVRDYISGMVIIGEDQYRVGELVKINGYEGYVEEVGLRLTKLRDFDGSLHIIQNGNISVVTNQARHPMMVRTEIYVDKSIDPSKVNKALERALERINGDDYKKEVVTKFINQGISKMTDFDAAYALYGFVKPETQWRMDRTIRGIAMEELLKHGLVRERALGERS